MKAIIVDDEKNARDVLNYILKKNFPDIRVCETCASADEGIAAIQLHSPDIVFLDIEMPKKSGFDMLQELGTVDFEIVFTTAYDKYAIKAFKFSAVDYLLKPVSQADLKQTVERIRRSKEQNNSINAAQIEFLLESMRKKELPGNRLALYTTEGVRFINPEKVIRCESSSNYTTFFFDNGEKILSSKTLKDVEEIFHPFSFYRVHNSHLINLRYVEKYNKEDGGIVVMSDGTEIMVARSRKDEFLNLFSKI